MASGSGEEIIIINCSNFADVLAKNNSAGGIVGRNCTKIENCYNEGNIQSLGEERPSGTYIIGCAGGIIGSGTTITQIYNCTNKGNVNSEISAGGIFGYKYATKIEIINSYNLNKIYGKKFSGGIIGETVAGNIQIYNSYNQGDVSGKEKVGGIAGYKYYTTTMNIYNCYNIGNIRRRKGK